VHDDVHGRGAWVGGCVGHHGGAPLRRSAADAHAGRAPGAANRPVRPTTPGLPSAVGSARRGRGCAAVKGTPGSRVTAPVERAAVAALNVSAGG